MRQDIKPMMVCRPIVFNTLAFSRDTVASYYNSSGFLAFEDPDILRQGYNPTTLAPIGAIIETESTNFITYSNDFSNADWSKNFAATVTDEPAEINPEGTSGCWSYNEAGSASLTQSVPFSPGEIAAISIYAKYPGSGTGILRLGGVGGSPPCFFDLTNGTISSGEEKSSIQALPNGWYRCFIFGAVDPASAINISIEGSSTDSIFIYGAQIEAGNVSSSYIETEDTAETRAEDVYGSPPTMASSNIPEDDYPDYNPATPYIAGDRVMVRSTYHRNYQAVTTTTGEFPPDNSTGTTPKWLDIGATNRWRMFDYEVGSDLQSINDSPIIFTVAVDTPVSSLSLLNIHGITAYVAMTSPVDGLIYEKTIDLVGDPPEATWWDYLFGRRQIIKNVTLYDFPENEGCTITVQIHGEDDTDETRLGKVIVGEGVVLGYTEYGSSIGIIDYSTKEPDLFGNYYIQERAFVGRADLKIIVEPGYESFVRDTLAAVRATPSVYIGHQDYEATIIYGFYKDFSILFSTPADSFCSMTIEGI